MKIMIPSIGKYYTTLLLVLVGIVGTSTKICAQLEREEVNIILDYQSIQQVKAADLDNDGDLDLIGTRRGYNGHIVYFEHLDGQGEFAAATAFGDTTWENYPKTEIGLQLGDLDNDGDVDLIPHKLARNEIPYWENDGTGDFTEPTTGQTYPTLSYRFYYNIVDLNQDGWLDILIYLYGSKTLAVNWNLGGTFQYEVLEEFEAPDHDSFCSIVISDYDQDGDTDLCFVYAKYVDVDVIKQLWITQYTQNTPTEYEETGSLLIAEHESYINQINVSTADFDLDGWPDISLAYHVEMLPSDDLIKLVFVKNQIGTGNYSIVSELDNYLQHKPADINGDGLVDLVAIYDTDQGYSSANNEPFAYHWLKNEGAFNFSEQFIDGLWTGRNLSMTDIDGDGLVDLLTPSAGSSLGPQMLWRKLENTAGGFSEPRIINEGVSYITATHITDWEADDDLDILITSNHHINDCCTDNIYLFKNEDGQGHFSDHERVMTLPGKDRGVHFVDLNGDGFSDVSGVVLLEENGVQKNRAFYALRDPLADTFSIELLNTLTLFHNPHLIPADIDTDGDLDLVFIEIEDGTIAVAWNELNDNGSFAEESAFLNPPTYLDPTFFTVRDIDQDGDQDFIFCTSDSIYWALYMEETQGFSSWQSLDASENDYLIDILVADFDGDGDLDLEYQTRDESLVSWVICRFNAELAAYEAPVIIEWNTEFISSYDYALPLNEDEAIDVVNAFGYRYSMPGSGYSTTPYVPNSIDRFLPGKFYQNAILGDIDGDGKKEMISGYRELVSYNLDFLPGQMVEGLLLKDSSASCLFDSLHPPLANWKVMIESDGQEQLANSNIDGRYAALLPGATDHLIKPVLPSDYWMTCPEDSTLISTTLNDNNIVHFSVEAVVDCPLLQLDMSTSLIRQCFSSTASIKYENIGTVAAEDARISFYFDDRFIPINSNVDWTLETDTSLIFEFSQIEAGAFGYITIELEPDCASLNIGEVVCFQAYITPDTLCSPMSSEWNGATLEASAICEGDSLAFLIQNTGFGGMEEMETYAIQIVNDDIVLLEIGDLQLEAGELDTIRVPANEDSYLLSIDQPAGHPNPEAIQLLTEGCINPIDTSLLNDFPGTNGDGFFVEQCEDVIGPYDPNIKVAIPMGFGPQHLIEAEQPIQYTIHFQNIGSDAARQVLIRDQLSPVFNLASFEAGAASHDHHWYILPDRTLVITFPEINLPDSTSNEAASKGFFSYTIQAIDSILPLTTIPNEAAIFFDYNPPIITNRTEHTILKPSVESVQFVSLCPGEEYFDIIIYQDTIFKEHYEMPYLDSIIWTHVDVLGDNDTLEQSIQLDEAIEWNGIWIETDTSILETYVNIFGCDSTVLYQFTIVTSTEEPYWATGISIQPNPTFGTSNLSWQDIPRGQKQLRIYGAQGQLLQEKYIHSSSGQLLLNFSQWSAGVYFLEFMVNGQQLKRPLVVLE